jgi:monothiol glutaredoxin
VTDVQEKIGELVKSDRVVLFMKGTRDAPRCGFSATVVEILDRYVPAYTTVDVLSDPEIRDGVKAFSDWPTIPQLYVRGEFVGGCDIVRDLEDRGELAGTLGDVVVLPDPPTVKVSAAALAVFRQAMADADPGDVLHVSIDGSFRHDLAVGPRLASDVVVEVDGLTLAFDAGSARRAAGLSIDYVEGLQSGFKMDNPNAPAGVRQVSPRDVKAWIDAGEKFEFLDVRTPGERDTAQIAGTTLLDRANFERVAGLPKDTKLVLHCHHGMRSFQAAEHFVRQGFRNVFNVQGGIAAWSRDVDPSVPTY